MIRPLRRAHLALWSALAVALPAALVAGLLARAPEISDLAGPLVTEPRAGEIVWEEEDLAPSLPLAARLGLDRSGVGGPVLEVEVHAPLRVPDPLLYWSDAEPSGSALAAESYLLGPLPASGVRGYRLPAKAARIDGTLVLYSLGHQSVVGSAPLPSASALDVRARP